MRTSRFDSASNGGKEGPILLPKVGALKVKFVRTTRKGKAHLRSENPDPADDSWHEIEAWLSLPNVGEELIEATVAIMSREKQTTRSGTHTSLRYGFIAFLNEVMPNAKLEDLCAETFREFIEWLDAIEPDGEERYSHVDKMHKLGVLRKLIRQLSPKLSALGVDHEVPVNQWPGGNSQQKKGGRKRKAKSKETIPLQQFIDLLRAAIEAYEDLVKEIDPLLPEIDKKTAEMTETGISELDSIEGVCATAILRYGGLLPGREWLKTKDRELFRAIEAFGYTRIGRIINPMVNDLIPAFIILQCFTHWNEQPLCCLTLAGVERQAGAFKNKYKLSSYKRRAKSMVRRSFAPGDEVFNPCNVVDFMERWSKHIRLSAPKKIRDDLFLYVSKYKGSKIGAVRSFAQPIGGKYSLTLNRKLAFFKDRGIVPVGGRALRQAAADYLRGLLKDSQKVSILLDHSSVTITDLHYRSREAQRLDEVALAGAMAMKVRHQESDGKIDPRGHYEDRSAATPGYGCVDPFDSPVVGQLSGRMCTAYGLCPPCPLRVLPLDDASWGRRIQLQQRYKQAALSMGTVRFHQRYGLAAEAVNTALMRLSDADLARIGRLTLNPIPELE